MVVGSFTSVSLDPPLVAYLPTRTSGSYARLRTSRHFCVNVLAADQQDLCGRFASRAEDKFDGVDWDAGGARLAGAVRRGRLDRVRGRPRSSTAATT